MTRWTEAKGWDDERKKALIEDSIEQCGSIRAAAKELGTTSGNLHGIVKRLKIDAKRLKRLVEEREFLSESTGLYKTALECARMKSEPGEKFDAIKELLKATKEAAEVMIHQRLARERLERKQKERKKEDTVAAA